MGVLSTTATLLSLRDISPNRGITRVSARDKGRYLEASGYS